MEKQYKYSKKRCREKLVKSKHKKTKSKRKYKPCNESIAELRDKLRNCPILIPQAAIDKLSELSPPHNTNCIALYVFYLKKAYRDGTPSIWCDNSYVTNGLNWSPGRVKRTRKILTELEYIKTKKTKDASGHFTGSYVVLKYYPSIKTIERSEDSAELNRLYTELGKAKTLQTEILKVAEVITTELERRKKQPAGSTKMIPSAGSTKIVPSAKKKKKSAGSTKTRPVVKSTPMTYSTPSRKTYSTQSPAKKRGSEGVDDSLFDDDIDKLNKAKLKNSFEYRSSIKLANAVKTPKAKRLHPIQRKPNILEWSKEFRNLHVKDGIEKNTIEYILNWYCLHIGEEHIPEAFCGESFREKFAQIVSAMIRAGDFDREAVSDIDSPDEDDNFPMAEEEWTDKDGKKHSRVEIDYGDAPKWGDK